MLLVEEACLAEHLSVLMESLANNRLAIAQRRDVAVRGDFALICGGIHQDVECHTSTQRTRVLLVAIAEHKGLNRQCACQRAQVQSAVDLPAPRMLL